MSLKFDVYINLFYLVRVQKEEALKFRVIKTSEVDEIEKVP